MPKPAVCTRYSPARAHITYTHPYYTSRTLLPLVEGYDRSVPPPSNRTSSSYSQAGVDVAMNLRFFKIESVMAADGRMALKVWLRLSWTDRHISPIYLPYISWADRRLIILGP